MQIRKITIKNFKSIKEMEFDIKKYGNSYTTMLVGINESGKSNILKAMSFLNPPKGEDYHFADYCNQKEIQNSESVDIFFDLKFEDKDTYLKLIQEKIEETDMLLDFEIDSIQKKVHLGRDEAIFTESYFFRIKEFSKKVFIKEVVSEKTSYILNEEQDEKNTFKELTEDVFKEYFKNNIIEIIKENEPSAIFWEATDEYLISKENLNEFCQNIDSKKALRNIFLLAGYDDSEKIQRAIDGILNPTQRSTLASKLNDALNGYLEKVWKHNIGVVIEITETGQLDIFIKDKGKKNKHGRHLINNRSEGAKHFLSLILSLSIESSAKKRKNQLILIDEPEAHLHPSGIRDLGKELLKIGIENFVFTATHSPFLIDKIKKERNIIIKKNDDAITEKREIKDHENFIDDEVLREAFGMEVYKDLLNPHSILVEGASDKIILQKAFATKDKTQYGITNGHGSNIDTLASKLNHSDISILVVLDDDPQGRRYKKKIIKINGSYSEKNVFTIRNLVGSIKDRGTIEDTLGKAFVESKFREFYGEKFHQKDLKFELKESAPFIEQIKKFLNFHKNYSDEFLECCKKKISEDFNPSKSALRNEFLCLNELINKIMEKLEAPTKENNF